MIRSLLCLFLLFSFSVSHSQDEEPLIPTQRVTFGNNMHTNRDVLFFSEVNSKGQLIVAGTTEKDYSFTNVQVKALNKDLQVLWTVERSWDGISYDYPMDVLIDSQDHVWVISKNVISLHRAHFVITRIDPQGKVLWEYISPEPVETSTLNMNQYFYYFSENGDLNFNYRDEGEDWYGIATFFKISPQGEVKDKYQRDGVILHLSQHEEKYHGLSYNDARREIHYLSFDENESEKTLLQHEVFDAPVNFVFQEESGVHTDKSGNLIFVGKGNFHNDHGFLHQGSILFSVAPSGELNYVIPNNGAVDKYLLGSKIDENNNLVLLSNTQPTQSEGEPLLTLEIFSEDGELLFHKVDEQAVGNIALMEEEKILVRLLDGNITVFDYKLKELDFYEVPPTELPFTPQGLQFLDGLPVLIGTTLDSPYPGSDYLSLQDHLVRKFDATGEVARMTYSGEGTSKLYTYSMFTNEDGNYTVHANEFTGPDNLHLGGSRSPKEKKKLTFTPQLELLEDEIVEEHQDWKEPEAVFIAENGDLIRYEVAEDKKTIKYYLNNNLIWERELELGSSYDEVIKEGIDKEGNFIGISARHSWEGNRIHKITPDEEYTFIKLDEFITDFVVLSNNWIFSYFRDNSIRIFSPRLELINSRQTTQEEVREEGYPNLWEKNNKVLFNIRHRNLVNVYDHYGNFVSNFKLEGNIHPSVALFDEQDALVVYHSIGNGIPLEHGHNWSRGAISRYEDIIEDFIGSLPAGDSDQDGIPDLYDQCPDTPLGTAVDDKGCALLQLPANHFTLKTKNETCIGKSNGRLEVNAAEEATYLLELNGENYNFNTNFVSENLQPGYYEVCIWMEGEEQTRRCYEFEIAEAEEFVATTRISTVFQKKELEVEVRSGTAPFRVKVNGVPAGDFSESIFSIPVFSGDEVRVSSAVECEGDLSLNVEGAAGIKLFPNPVGAEIELFFPEVKQQEFLIEIYNSSGQKVRSLWENSDTGELNIPASDLQRGVYFLRLYLDEVETIKMLKS